MHALDIFHPLTARWFAQKVGTPTAVQEAAWPAIAAGGHTLVSAPTGTGKTLASFLVYIDRLKALARAGTLPQELQLIYVSPLKSLAGDIRENLRRPLDGISEEERAAGVLPKRAPFDLDIAIRTGDTPQSERRRMIKSPPHILITTPESLYLMLTSKSGATILRTAKWIILDELHALIDSKRGAHLMLSLARLDRLCSAPLQRVGLSATIEPLHIAAEYLAPDPVTIVAPEMRKEVALAVTSPQTGSRIIKKDMVWQELAAAVYEHCKETRTAIAFVEGRAYAEKLAYYVNQIAGDGFARTHHGSLSKEQRFEAEDALRSGQLRLLCATSSMELGIDVGEIDRVFQIGCPRSISSTMQRLGRAGHNPGRVSVMHIFPRAAAEALYSGLAAEVVRSGGIEYSHPPRLCLDVLAQHLVSMAVDSGYTVDDVMPLLQRAYPFRDVTKEDVKSVLCMLAGDYEHQRDLPVRPRILYDRIHERVEGDPYSRMLAVSAGGTIPDKGLYTARTETGVKLGELDEEYVYEARVGDKFLLGSFAWQIAAIQKDVVVVKPSSAAGARAPFWKGEVKGRNIRTGMAYGEIFRRLFPGNENGTLPDELKRLGLDEEAAKDAADVVRRQIASMGALPDDRTILVEHFRDETGIPQMMVHSVFGRPVNEPLAILASEEAKRQTHVNISYVDDDDGFLLFPFEDRPLPEGLLQTIPVEKARAVLEALLPATPLFNMTFRYNTGRALMMGVRKTGRQPLWVQRLRSAEMLDSLARSETHPLIRETRRECLEDYWDLDGAEHVLNGIRSGAIRVVELYTDAPSPMSFLLRRQTEAAMMYDYTPTPQGVHFAVGEALQRAQMIPPAPEQLAMASARRKLPEDDRQLHSLLMIEGDLIAGELDIPVGWLDSLARMQRALYIEPGLWIAAEHTEEYSAALESGDKEARRHIVRRALRYRGAQSAERLAERYFWTDEEAQEVLSDLCRQGSAVESDGLYYHAELYDRAQRETVRSRRRQIRTLPAERYAAMLAERVFVTAPADEKAETAIRRLCGLTFPASQWESALLPARITGYRTEMLDTLLSQGKYIWRLSANGDVTFYRCEDVDWDAAIPECPDELTGSERVLYEALSKRGATSVLRLSGLLEGGESPYGPLMRLAEMGLACADSFAPIRQRLAGAKISGKYEKSAARQRVRSRLMATESGRWEIVRPLAARTAEQLLERAFDSTILLCRETLQSLSWAEGQGLTWSAALEILRVWEYTGRARRGYFVEGLSGVQFLRDKDYAAVTLALEQPQDAVVWLNAADPSQPWGKALPHRPDRAFLNVPGTAVALHAGLPAAVFERQGKTLRVFDGVVLAEVLRTFTLDFGKKRMYPMQNRLTVTQYPPEAEAALSAAGFRREMKDFVLYRDVR